MIPTLELNPYRKYVLKSVADVIGENKTIQILWELNSEDEEWPVNLATGLSLMLIFQQTEETYQQISSLLELIATHFGEPDPVAIDTGVFTELRRRVDEILSAECKVGSYFD